VPEHNTGALVKEVNEFVFDDAAIIACLLRSGTADGHHRHGARDDPRPPPGATVEGLGVQGEVRHSREIRTPGKWMSRRNWGAHLFLGTGSAVLDTLDAAIFRCWKEQACYTLTGMTGTISARHGSGRGLDVRSS